MLPWLIDLGLNVVDLGLAAAAVALLVEGLPGGSRLGRRSREEDAAEDAVGGREDDVD